MVETAQGGYGPASAGKFEALPGSNFVHTQDSQRQWGAISMLKCSNIGVAREQLHSLPFAWKLGEQCLKQF